MVNIMIPAYGFAHPARRSGGRRVVDRIAPLERRIRQFEHYLGLMEHRTLQLAKSDCFLIFSRRLPRGLRARLSADTRIVQFAFLQKEFYLDLPDTTLTPEEARGVVAHRPGFAFALADSRRKKGEAERQFDPVQKFYRYDEQRAAAEDAAYVFFEVWRLPVEAWIKVTAATFQGSRRWEQGFSMA